MQQIADIIQFAKANKSVLQAENCWVEPFNNMQKHAFNAMVLLSLENHAELCRFLNTNISELENIINAPSYKHFTIRKRRGGERHIHAPEKQLKIIQSRLNYFLQAWYLQIKPNEVHGFVINPHYLGEHCNIVANAAVHTGKKQVLNIDLKDFFPSIPARHVKNIFTSPFFNFNEPMAIALTLLTTYEGKLPVGAPTSPVLSNFACLMLDARLRYFCDLNGLAFTRYADDLTFSSEAIISDDTVQDIIQIIRGNGFEINKRKLRIQPSNRKQTVTGLTVNEKVNVDRKLLKRIRAMLHELVKYGLFIATRHHFRPTVAVDARLQTRFLYRLGGYINFVGQVRGKNDALYLKLKKQFDPLLAQLRFPKF